MLGIVISYVLAYHNMFAVSIGSYRQSNEVPGILCQLLLWKVEDVTVYRLPIRLPAKSALTWPVVELVAFKPSQKLVVSSIPVGSTFFVEKEKEKGGSLTSG